MTIAPAGEDQAKADVIISASKFNQLIRMISDNEALVEPGMTIESLNGQLSGMELPLLAKE